MRGPALDHSPVGIGPTLWDLEKTCCRDRIIPDPSGWEGRGLNPVWLSPRWNHWLHSDLRAGGVLKKGRNQDALCPWLEGACCEKGRDPPVVWIWGGCKEGRGQDRQTLRRF